MEAQDSTGNVTDLRHSGVLYHPDPEVGSVVKWYTTQPGMIKPPGLGESLAWSSPTRECFGTVTKIGSDNVAGITYLYAEVTVDRIEPRPGAGSIILPTYTPEVYDCDCDVPCEHYKRAEI